MGRLVRVPGTLTAIGGRTLQSARGRHYSREGQGGRCSAGIRLDAASRARRMAIGKRDQDLVHRNLRRWRKNCVLRSRVHTPRKPHHGQQHRHLDQACCDHRSNPIRALRRLTTVALTSGLAHTSYELLSERGHPDTVRSAWTQARSNHAGPTSTTTSHAEGAKLLATQLAAVRRGQ